MTDARAFCARFFATAASWLALAGASGALAADPGPRGPASPGEVAPMQGTAALLDLRGLAAWADREVGAAVAAHRLSAAVVMIVERDRVIVEKAYGVADAATNRPVDLDRTEFLIGSATKTFTATAIAQLLETGRIASLDDPVNKYLRRFKLPGPAGDSVTFWHVLTHSAGFELRNAGLASYTAQPIPLTPELLERYRTPIVMPPGTYSSYANFGTTLLGAVVEDVTGQRIDAYVRDHIFAPLGMTNTRMNVSPERPADLVHAYRVGGGSAPEELPWLPFSVAAAPAGSISTTPRDMLKYVRAHLGTSPAGTPPILSPATLALMHAPKFGNHPDVTQFGMQFFTSRWNDEQLVEHGGNWPYNISLATLIPARGIGIFLTTVGDSREPAGFMPVWEVRASLLAQLFGPQRYETREPLPKSLREYVGRYQNVQRNESNLEAVLALVQASTGDSRTNAMVKVVEEDGRGGLSIQGVPGYVPIGADRFWKKDYVPNPGWAGPLYAFSRDAGGAVVRLTDYFATDTAVRVSPGRDLGHRGRIAQFCMLVLTTGLLAFLWKTRMRAAGVARFCAVLAAVLTIALPLVLFVVTAPGGFGYYLLSGQTGRWLAFALVSNALAATVFGLAFAAWRSGLGTTPPTGWREHFARWHCALLVLAGLAFVAVLASVNALGVHLP